MMARYTGPVCRICRRHGMKLFLKGARCFGPKCAVERRRTQPGAHPQARRKVTEYGVQLAEKQKIRSVYGVLERQCDQSPRPRGHRYPRERAARRRVLLALVRPTGPE